MTSREEGESGADYRIPVDPIAGTLACKKERESDPEPGEGSRDAGNPLPSDLPNQGLDVS
ncbi:hypothetical protein CIHG_03276 [Coccidioides immitis H538.4]|uniref:Uncharacterized protein n=3 Tax=Coccidioides immitis TaxID=5501 RepID=A0A0J8U117_COCIT|nr:hypothetical protein CIRG_00970 [Coccidioides immitis RMSCC 2394]KMU80017.1 hypothetical protein CISG_08177 [Coccidioides immitis RMSCC 3703]KMU85493.1 hypothetical protein CIHG_03276 [Coccidioides immitis H538.4]